MSRKVAREELFKLIFELCFHKPEDSQSYEEFLETTSLTNENLEFVKDVYSAVVENHDFLLTKISENIKGYTIERLFKVDLALLLIASAELYIYKQTPSTVVVNEAVELAKKYSTDKSYGFINAVIASLIKDSENNK